MRGAVAERRRRDGRDDDRASAGRWMKPSENLGRPCHGPAVSDVANSACNRYRQRNRRGRANRDARGNVAPQQETDRGDRTWCRSPGEHRDAPDHAARRRQAAGTRELPRGRRLDVAQELCRRERGVDGENDFQHRRRKIGGQRRGHERATDDARSHASHRAPVHGALGMMRAHACNRGEDDRGKRRAQRERYDLLPRKSLATRTAPLGPAPAPARRRSRAAPRGTQRPDPPTSKALE